MNPSTEAQTEGTPKAFRPSIALHISGDGLDFDEVTRTLGLTPTCTLRRGEILEDVGQPAERDLWAYRPLTEDGMTMDECVMRLWDALRAHKDYLRVLKRHFQVTVQCSCMSRRIGKHPPVNMGGLRLGHECLSFFTELEIPLNVGLTHFHDAA